MTILNASFHLAPTLGPSPEDHKAGRICVRDSLCLICNLCRVTCPFAEKSWLLMSHETSLQWRKRLQKTVPALGVSETPRVVKTAAAKASAPPLTLGENILKAKAKQVRDNDHRATLIR